VAKQKINILKPALLAGFSFCRNTEYNLNMTWKTHLTIGANSIWLLALGNHNDSSILVLLPVAMIASLLPDIDSAGGGAKIHYIGGGILSNFKGMHGKYFHHRGILHSLFMAAVFTIILLIINLVFLHNAYPLLPAVFFVSYFSHPIIDGFNTGVGYLYPFSRTKFALLPRAMRSPLNGITDNALFVLGSFGLVIFLVLYGISLSRLPNAI
jgi:membrane-bound metal-dependent hydrolase YbcI (DUF457 family)